MSFFKITLCLRRAKNVVVITQTDRQVSRHRCYTCLIAKYEHTI